MVPITLCMSCPSTSTLNLKGRQALSGLVLPVNMSRNKHTGLERHQGKLLCALLCRIMPGKGKQLLLLKAVPHLSLTGVNNMMMMQMQANRYHTEHDSRWTALRWSVRSPMPKCSIKVDPEHLQVAVAGSVLA